MIAPDVEAEIEAILGPLRAQQPGITCGEAVNHLPARLRGPFWERAIDRYLTGELARLDKRRPAAMTDTTIDPAIGRRILDLPMQDNDADAATVRDYLIALLAALWREGEDFSGEHPLGKSGWEYDLYQPLVAAGLIHASFEPYGWVVDHTTADALIAAAIHQLDGEDPEPSAVAHQLRAIAEKPNLLAGWQATHGLGDDATVPQVLTAVADWLDGGQGEAP